MPDIFEQYNSATAKQTEEEQNPTQFNALEGEQEQQQNTFEAPLSLEGNVSGDAEQQELNENTQYSNEQLGTISTQNTRELEEDPESWSPEYTLRGFMEESGNSIMRGIGKHFVKGTGDLLQVAGSWFGGDIANGNFISRALQESGDAMAAEYKSYIPEELLHENLSMASMMNPKFWSTHVAEMVPQLAEFIFLSKGGSSVAKKGASSLMKRLPGTTKTALGKEVFGTGKGLIGKLATDQGLTNLGKTITGAIGGGVTGNAFAGVLNAAEVVNSNKDLTDQNGNPLYTEEELSQMASGTMRNNASWMLVDIASWGMTYGGGWNALKKLNPVAKGGKLYNTAQRSKIASNLFRYDTSPIVKSLARVAGKGITEGIEETFQETYEEWAKKKAISDVTGEPLEYDNYWDFYNSKENEATKVLSFAVGALGGASFNVTDLINKKADENYKLYNRIENLSKVVEKQGTEEELSWQEYHIRQQIADIVIDDKIDLYDDFSNKLVENGNITEDEKQVYDDLVVAFADAKQKAYNLNVKGLSALMYNVAKESYFDQKLADYEAIAKQNIDTVNSLDTLSNSAKQQKIKEIEKTFESRLKALSILKAEAKQNQENLIIGKKANPLNVEIILDEFGNEMVVGGLSTEQSEDYLLERGLTLQNDIDNPKKEDKFKIPTFSNLAEKGKEFAKGLINSFIQPKENEASGEQESSQEASGTTTINEEKVQTPKTEAEANTEAEKIIDEAPVAKTDENEIISDEVFNDYVENNTVPDNIINDIAEKIYNKKEISPREDTIRNENKDLIREKIVQQILGTERVSTDPDLQEDGTETSKKSPKVPKNETNEPISVEEDPELNQEENDFLNSEVNEDESGESIEDAKKSKEEQAKEKFNVKKENVENSEEKIGLDKRSKNEQKTKSIFKKNLMDYKFAKAVLNKIRNFKTTEGQNISQNELDNYLNRYTTYNLKGPSDLDKMSIVNHQLKRMFPNSNEPVQAFIVRNLFESLGSVGLGHALAGTIYIDTKAWNQDKVFMHEMAHIYYKLSLDGPETQALVKKALANKELVAEIKNRYDDYTLYNVVVGDQKVKYTKGQIVSALLDNGADKNTIQEHIQKEIKNGTIEIIPLTQQDYLKEELFTSMLEGPLADNFDKIFTQKTEPARQKDVKKWWGLLRKKGEIIQAEDNVSKMLQSLNDEEVPSGSLSDYIFNTFKAVTKGVKFDSFGLDARAKEVDTDYQEALEDISQRKKSKINNVPKNMDSLSFEEDRIDAIDNSLENDGEMFFDKSFDSKIKATSRIIKRFGIVYNKALRTRFLKKNKGKVVDKSKQKLFNRDLFESTIYNLAIENNNSNAFIYNIENSALEEVQAFNRFLNKVHPDTKEQLLNSMHFVLSNSKHIVGFRNTLSDNGKYEFTNSLAQKEINRADNVLESLRYAREQQTESYKNFEQSVSAILNGQEEKQDYFNVIEMLTGNNFNLEKVLEQGYITFKGVNVPIETLISGFIKRGLIFNGKNPLKGIYVYNARPLVEAFINTNRKFTPLSSVKNAEGNMEPVRITNNHMTKEVDNMINFLSPDANGNKATKEQFLKKFSHLAHKNKDKLGKAYVPNQLLENIYDNYEKGILPTISQYHGIEDISNKKGNLYKNSTAVEQGIEDFLIFVNSSRTPAGRKNTSYLGSLGTFSDSPRKFFMNMKKVNFEDVFSYKDGKLRFKSDGKIINSILNLHGEIYNDELKDNKPRFKKEFLKSITNTVAFVNNNANEISKIDKLSSFFKNGKLTKQGQELVAEYVINTTVNGYNTSEIFLPGIKGENTVKRFKMNSSPVLSVKNPNFKIEPVFFADEIIDNGIAGTDSGMFITKETAEKLQALGKGVFDMNAGFKLLNASVEKNNPNFKGKTAYLKGYTTIIDETHPLHKVLKAREDKYNAYHKEKYGAEPSLDLSDGSFNHIAIAIPQSSDKSNFFEEQFTSKNENGDLEYTESGLKMTPEALSNDISYSNEIQDKLYYSKKGDFVGIESYNFGPQQLMDKTTTRANTPVQMINSIIVNSTLNNNLNVAHEIQQHIANQKRNNLQKMLDSIKSENISDYKKIIEKGLNKEDMNQAQKILFEDNGSLSHPYINEIIVNQLAKTIRREGNKLSTPGTYAHQKPDIGYNFRAQKVGARLKGYQENTDGSLIPAQIVLPKHMTGKVSPRKEYTVYTHEQELFRIHKDRKSKDKISLDDELKALKSLATKGAQKRAFAETGNSDNYPKFLGETKNDKGVTIGYHVKGENVIASRVPGHGPSSTGVFEVIDFDKGDGNQVMVPSEFNEIIGSDNDGDALFVQTKGSKKDYNEWNQAFQKITEYWLSPEMKDQVQAKMIFEDDTKKTVDQINSQFPKNKDYVFPFSPEQRMKDYNNTMVSKRNVGPVFNIHKITNMLAAYEIKTGKSIFINRTPYAEFKDVEKGNNSRNQQSAILANIILDNAKHGFADDLGLNEHNISQAVLMVNLGIPLVDVGKILNSPAAKMWSDLNRNNNSMFHDSKRKDVITREIYKALGLKKTKSTSLKVQTNLAHEKGQQASIIELLNYLSDMNSEIQKISAIMSGHNKIHVNPLVLEKQIKDFKQVLSGSLETKTLLLDDNFKSNPDLQNYLDVAEETLKHMKRLNPVYRESTNKVLKSLNKKIGEDMGTNQLERISKDLSKFNTSRLLGLNNINKEYAKDLLNPKSPTSIFSKLNTYLNPLKRDIVVDEKDILKSVSKLENSVLFRQALNMNLIGNNKYVSANSAFVNDSFNELERERAQQEFEELPTEIQDDLILYDMIQNGWKGPQSIAPFFGRDTNLVINMTSNDDINNKNDEISQAVLNELEKTIALKSSLDSNNPFDKVYLKGNVDLNKKSNVIPEILKNRALVSKIAKGQPIYINARKFKSSALYELKPFSAEDIDLVKSERGTAKQRERIIEIAKSKIELIPNTLNSNPDLDIALISDKNVMAPFKTYNSYRANDKDLDPLVEATIQYEELSKRLRENIGNKKEIGLDAREDFDSPLFEKEDGLTYEEHKHAMEYRNNVSETVKKDAYGKYLKAKKEANKEAKSVLDSIDSKSNEELLNMYETYGEKDAYAYSIIMTPIIKKLANNLASEQSTLTKKEFDGKDVSPMQAYLMTGSTIPSNHPAAQGLARMMEKEYKNFINEKKKYISKMNEVTNALYKEKLGYGGNKSISNTFKRIRDVFRLGRANVYDKLYGNLVEREERVNEKGTLVYDYKLRPQKEIDSDFKKGYITKAEKDFYDYFRKTTNELMPKKIKEFKEDYIPHTAMTKLEVFSSRGLLGLMVNSKPEDDSIYDVKLRHKDENGNPKLMNFKRIEDQFKMDSATVHGKNNINQILEYRKLKQKAKKLLKQGLNEDGSKIIFSPAEIETALGFGAINRFSNNRSVKATELPSMDLNKALGDYIHSTLFVNGNENFQGMERLQGYIDGVLAFNRENNLKNANTHVQKVWKDYFLRNKRQTSVFGKKADKVILGLTRMNLFYSLGYNANRRTGGLYAMGNVLAGKYHNIKDIGGKAWLKGEARFWGIDKGFQGGIQGVIDRRKRMARIMKNINFMEINVYDEVNMEKKNGLDAVFADIALAPMIISEKWIQQVHMLGLLSDEELNKFDDAGNYKTKFEFDKIQNERLIELEDQVKSSHGRGYQPTDQRAVQMYSWGNMLLQFSRFIPTMFHDRFAKKDVNIYGKENIGTLRAVGDMVRHVANDPKKYVEYRNSLSPEARKKLDSGLKGMAMASIISIIGATTESDTANNLFWDTNYYWNHPKLSSKMVPAPVQTTRNLVNDLF